MNNFHQFDLICSYLGLLFTMHFFCIFSLLCFWLECMLCCNNEWPILVEQVFQVHFEGSVIIIIFW